jgi:hypothetical protein
VYHQEEIEVSLGGLQFESQLLLDGREDGLPQRFTEMLSGSSAARRLIDALADLQQKQFGEKIERHQTATDPNEIERIGGEISRELFGR